MLLDNLYREPTDLYDLSTLLFKTGDYDGSNFIDKELRGWEKELANREKDMEYYELKEDELSVGMREVFNLVDNLYNTLQNSSRLNRKQILDALTEIKQEIGEYV